MEQKKNLFDDFPPVSTQAWEEKIHADLKGADYEKRLVWNAGDKLRLKPYYRSEDMETIPHMGVLPAQAPYVRGNKELGNDWIIRQDLHESDPAAANALARKAIEKGAGSVGLNVSEVHSEAGMKQLLSGIDLQQTGVHLMHGNDHPKLFGLLCETAGTNGMNGSLDFDPLGYLLLYNTFPKSKDASMKQGKTLLEEGAAQMPSFRVLGVNGQFVHNAGGSVVQELAFALSHGNEYLVRLTAMGVPACDIVPRMQFTFAIGAAYFLEIAKLRAARLLWTKIVEQHTPQKKVPPGMFIHAVTSGWNKSVYDPYVNMLRTTTEAMAAAVGGADSLTVGPFDDCFKKPDEFSLRIARNQQIILKHEAYFNKVADPAGGSYYVEALTDAVARAAWDLFVETEERGGFIKAAETGFIRSSVENTCQQRDMEIAMRKRVFVGANMYPNTEEKMLDKVEPTAKLSDLSGLRQYRGTQAFEVLRMAVENHIRKGLKQPTVFLLTYGNPVMRKARASFSGNFFGVAGYQVIDNLGFTDIDTGVREALAAKADIVVLCSSDEEYEAMAPAATQIKKQSPKTLVMVAGNPKEIREQLTEAGVDHFIHLRTNVLEALTHCNAILEVN